MSRPVTSRRVFLKQAGAAGAAGLLVACGRGDQPRQMAPAPDTPFPAPAVRRGLKGAITVVYADELGLKPKYVEQAAAALRLEHPDATVTINLQRVSGSEFYPWLRQALEAGDAPDVLHVSGDRIGEMVDAGYIEALDEYLKDWPDWRYYPPWVRASVSYQGRVWAIPYGLDTRFLYFRRDLFEQAGLSRTWQPQAVDDMLSAAAAIKARVPTVIPYALYAGRAGDTGTANHAFLPLLYAYGGALQDSSGRWIGDSAAIRKTLTYYARAY